MLNQIPSSIGGVLMKKFERIFGAAASARKFQPPPCLPSGFVVLSFLKLIFYLYHIESIIYMVFHSHSLGSCFF